jgi:hypothetical protein
MTVAHCEGGPVTPAVHTGKAHAQYMMYAIGGLSGRCIHEG